MEELLNGTMEQATETLAQLAAGTRAGVFQKQAAPAWLTSLGEHISNNPTLSHGLIGSGIGAAAMGANTALNNRGQSPEKKKSVLGSILAGGLAGGGIGAGAGIAREGLSGIRNAGGGISGTEGMKPGQFTDPTTGTKMQVDPKALKEHPELASQIKSLSTPSLQSQVGGGVLGTLGAIKDKTPYSFWGTLGLAGADAALHNPFRRANPEQVGGYYGRQALNDGVKSMTHLPEWARNALAGNKGVGLDATTGVTTTVHGHEIPAGKTVLDYFGEMKKPQMQGSGPLITLEQTRMGEGSQKIPGQPEVKATAGGPPARAATPDVTHKIVTPVMDEHGNPLKEKVTISASELANARREGLKTHAETAGRHLYRVPGTNKFYRGMTSLRGAAGVRAGYLLPFLTEYTIGGIQEDEANKKTMREIMQRYAKPVPEGK